MPLPPDPSGTPPASRRLLWFPSGGVELLGQVYLPAGPGPHPVALLLHGMPGSENNFDLAHAVRRAGTAVFFFHYRGAWGSPGAFQLGHMIEDVRAALDFLDRPQVQADLRIDADRRTLIGHSMGGWAGLVTTANDRRVKQAAFLGGFNAGLIFPQVFGDPDLTAQAAGAMENGMRLLNTTAETVIAEAAKHGEAWNLLHLAPRLAKSRLLLIGADKDLLATTELHHAALVAALNAAGASDLTHHLLDGDHVFSQSRIALAEHVLDWLATDG
ncbi:MAG: alpha/beta fold hydrolase [Bacteroidota bacterium]